MTTPKPPTHDAQGRRLSPHGAVLPAWYPDLATRIATNCSVTRPPPKGAP